MGDDSTTTFVTTAKALSEHTIIETPNALVVLPYPLGTLSAAVLPQRSALLAARLLILKAEWRDRLVQP